MKRLINLLILQILTFVSFSQTRTTSGDAIRKEITPKYINGVIKQLTIAQLKAQAITNGDSTTLYYVTDTGKKGYFELDKNDNSSIGNDSTIIVTNSGKRLKRTIEQYLAPSTTGKYYRGDKTWQVISKSDIPTLSNVDNTSDLNKPISTATQTALLGKLDKGYSISELRGLSNSVLAATQIFYCSEIDKEGFWKYDASDNSSSDNLGTILVTGGGKRLKRIIQDNVYTEWFGAVADGIIDDSNAIQNAIDFVYSQASGGCIKFRGKVYMCRELHLKTRVSFSGEYNSTILRFYRGSYSDSYNSTKYLLYWEGGFNSIDNIIVDGRIPSIGYSVGNGIYISGDPLYGGLHRTLSNSRVEKFAGYSPTNTGTYGMNKVFSKSEITNSNGDHLILGGNGIVISSTSYTNWELVVDNVAISKLDGDGFYGGTITDSKFNNLFISQCMNRGFVLEKDNKNCQGTNIKVYLCRMLNVNFSGSESLSYIIPHNEGVSEERQAAVVITGANHNFHIESQENGSHGFKLGNDQYSCNNSYFNLLADGNGGYSVDADNATSANYRRYGILLTNYYRLDINGFCDDFRAKFGLPRQQRGLHCVGTKPTFNTLSQLIVDNWYKIADNSGSANFIPLQKFITPQSNITGTIFQARAPIGQGLDVTTNFGTGYLSAVNDFSNINLQILNQWEQDNSISSGYSISGDGGNSYITINGNIINNNYIKVKDISTNTLLLKTLANTPSGLDIRGGSDGSSSRLFFSTEDNLSQSFSIRKSGGSLIFGVNATPGSGSGTSKLLFTATGNLQPNTDNDIDLGSTSSRWRNVYTNKLLLSTGTNKSVGTLALTSGLGTITSTAITTNSIIWITTKTLSGTSAHDYTYNISADGTATITARQNNGSTETGCNSTIQYWIIN